MRDGGSLFYYYFRTNIHIPSNINVCINLVTNSGNKTKTFNFDRFNLGDGLNSDEFAYNGLDMFDKIEWTIKITNSSGKTLATDYKQFIGSYYGITIEDLQGIEVPFEVNGNYYNFVYGMSDSY